VKERVIDYYDLIELPSGAHVPVPLALREGVPLSLILKIPVSRKKRTDEFYYCEKCDVQPYSFFRCAIHRPVSEEETRIKLKVLKTLIFCKQLRKLRYIENGSPWWKGWKGYIRVIGGKVVFWKYREFWE